MAGAQGPQAARAKRAWNPRGGVVVATPLGPFLCEQGAGHSKGLASLPLHLELPPFPARQAADVTETCACAPGKLSLSPENPAPMLP